MALRTRSVFVVFLCSVTVVLGQDGWGVSYTNQSVCALRGSSVDLPCSYTYPRGQTVTATKWWAWKSGVWSNIQELPEYAGRVEYPGDTERDCTLRITDLRKTDSTTYCFWFKTNFANPRPGVSLSVTDLQVKVTPSGQNVTLTCSSTCPLTGDPSYIWYQNGQSQQTTSQQISVIISYFSVSYSCAIEGQEDLHHSPAVPVCVSGQRCSRVSYSNRRVCVLKGSSVDVSCTYNSYLSVTSTLWFSPERRDRWRDRSTPEDLAGDPEYAGRVQHYSRPERRDSTLRITDLRERDSAEYRFIFKTRDKYYDWGDSFPGTILTVTGLQVKVTPATVTEGEWATLTCSSTCPLTGDPSYIWYQNGVLQYITSQQISVSSYYSDSYSCAVEGHEDLRSLAVSVSHWTPGSPPTANIPLLVSVVVLSVLAAGALLVLLWCTLKRRSNRGSDVTGDTQTPTSPQGDQPDPSSDTYTALHMRNRSPDYDTLASVSGTNIGRSSEYENIQ